MDKMLLTRWFWLILFLPFVFAGIRVAQVVWYDASALGPDPAQNLVDLFGTIALWFLCAVLFVTPVQTVIKTRWLLRQRRALGVACFAYALLHWLSYAGLLLEWQWQNLGQDLLNRPYIIVGFLAGLMLAVLAGTSNNTSVRALGTSLENITPFGLPCCAANFDPYVLGCAKRLHRSRPVYGSSSIAVAASMAAASEARVNQCWS